MWLHQIVTLINKAIQLKKCKCKFCYKSNFKTVAKMLFLGVGNIVACMIIQPFVCEISNPSLRSLTTTFWLLSYSLGFSSMFLFGAVMPWRLAVGLPVVVAVVALVGFQFIHDSPARCFFGVPNLDTFISFASL